LATIRWTAEVMYDGDGSKHATLAGDRISSQLVSNADGTCRCVIIVSDAGCPVESFQAARVWSVHRKRINPEEGT